MGNKDHLQRLNRPVIRRVQCSHERILIEVSDHVLMSRVEVTVLDEAGNIAEQGEALRGDSNRWEYIPRTLGMMVTVRAWDLAGNVCRFVAV